MPTILSCSVVVLELKREVKVDSLCLRASLSSVILGPPSLDKVRLRQSSVCIIEPSHSPDVVIITGQIVFARMRGDGCQRPNEKSAEH